MSATVIALADRRGQAQSEPALDPDQAYLARLFYIPAYKSLPFITLKEPRERTGTYNDASSYWNDVPTDDQLADRARGIAYAQMAVAAIEADQCRVCRGLELTFEHIYRDAIRRREKGGKYSRSMPQASVAFLGEIARTIHTRAVRQ
jgi:hypothetical protein